MAMRPRMIGGPPRAVRDAELLVRGAFADDGALDRARDWARGVLARRGLDARRSPLRASRALAREDPRLAPVVARWLVAHLEEQPGESSARRRPPQLR